MPNSPALPYDDKPWGVIVASLARHKQEANRQHHYPRPHARNPTRLSRSGAFHHIGGRGCAELPRISIPRTPVNRGKIRLLHLGNDKGALVCLLV
jgi:hypothetical protein